MAYISLKPTRIPRATASACQEFDQHRPVNGSLNHGREGSIIQITMGPLDNKKRKKYSLPIEGEREKCQHVSMNGICCNATVHVIRCYRAFLCGESLAYQLLSTSHMYAILAHIQPTLQTFESRFDATRMLRVTWLTFRSDTECVNIVTCDCIGRDHREEPGGIYPRWRTSCIYTSVALQDYRSTRCILRPGDERKKSR
jgi:hypothetical protein